MGRIHYFVSIGVPWLAEGNFLKFLSGRWAGQHFDCWAGQLFNAAVCHDEEEALQFKFDRSKNPWEEHHAESFFWLYPSFRADPSARRRGLAFAAGRGPCSTFLWVVVLRKSTLIRVWCIVCCTALNLAGELIVGCISLICIWTQNRRWDFPGPGQIIDRKEVWSGIRVRHKTCCCV